MEDFYDVVFVRCACSFLLDNFITCAVKLMKSKKELPSGHFGLGRRTCEWHCRRKGGSRV